MRVIVDTEKCVAAGQCVIEAPEVFDQSDEDGVVLLLNASPAEDQLEAVRRAAELCPAMAIDLVED